MKKKCWIFLFYSKMAHASIVNILARLYPSLYMQENHVQCYNKMQTMIQLYLVTAYLTYKFRVMRIGDVILSHISVQPVAEI